MIMRMRKLSDGRVKILIQGVAKAAYKNSNAIRLTMKWLWKDWSSSGQSKCGSGSNDSHSEGSYWKNHRFRENFIPDILLVLDDVPEPGRLSDLIASNLGIKVQDGQKF